VNIKDSQQAVLKTEDAEYGSDIGRTQKCS
jgi:hypothetical protein